MAVKRMITLNVDILKIVRQISYKKGQNMVKLNHSDFVGINGYRSMEGEVA